MAAKKNAEKKPNIIQRVGKFFPDCKYEMKKIVWPTIPVTFKNTGVVLSSIALAASFIGAFDFLLTLGLGSIMNIAH